MYPSSSQPSGVPIERGDGRPCALVDDALSQACGLAIEEVDARGLLMVDDGINVDEDHLEWAETDVNDIDEVGSGTFSTPKKVDGEKGVVNTPFVGQAFDRWESAYDFYNAYGLATGFGVRKSSTSSSMKTNEVISRAFVCDREGLKRERDKGKIDNAKEMRERRIVRLNCKARMIIKHRDEKWVVKTFEDIHSYELTSLLKTKMLRSHNRFHKSEGTKALIDCPNETQMPKSKIVKAINSTHDGVTGGLSINQVIAHLRAKRNNNLGQEAVIVANHLQKKRSEDPNFFFSMELDTDGTFRSMFWADARARDAYMIFNDVIVFYVTYKTNRLSLPFAPFTGLNHHKQSTLFGAALLADETDETFCWVFEQWLTCMHGRAPGVIITDMDLAMKNAIKIVFPDTRHRFCEWHIWKHLLEKVVEMRDTDSDFYRDYNRCFHSKKIECEDKWQDLVVNYGICRNEWLSRMWEQREHWMRAYWRTTFTAGMKSSQRSESMNSFFDGYVNNNTGLHEFLTAYERALVQRRKTEAEEDFKSKYSIPKMQTNTPLEEEAG
ncbi:protein FAR1-RELATED SEQUENCE 5-like [Tasmannia lanceolata]|uniref:protein FAR1-RELATED SEQUENCE 5-like n=1 Tax=Tasmannia lanceolata TaxID=3420 RepID=UPI004064B16C